MMHRTSSSQPFRTSTAPPAGRDEVCLNFHQGCPCFFHSSHLPRTGSRLVPVQKEGATHRRTLNPSTPTVSVTQQMLHHKRNLLPLSDIIPRSCFFWLCVLSEDRPNPIAPFVVNLSIYCLPVHAERCSIPPVNSLSLNSFRRGS